MLALLLRVGTVAASAASAGVAASASPSAASGASVVDLNAPASLLDVLAVKTRALFGEEFNHSSLASLVANAPAAAAKIAGVDPIAAGSAFAYPSTPLSTLLPSTSTLVACALALCLYVASWSILSSAADDDDERRRASFNTMTSPKKVISESEKAVGLHPLRAPAAVRAVHAVVRVLHFMVQCVVLAYHWVLVRLPLRTPPVYLRGFTCATMPADWTVTTERFRRTAMQNFGLPDQCVSFCLKLLGRSGLGESTCFPPGLMSYPPDLSMQAARAEAEYVFKNALDALFASTGIHPKDVDILIVNCSLFAPTPSLAAMIMNMYKMREDIDSYNLSGMGCSAGLVSIHLAKQLLQQRPGALAVIVSTELITQQMYTGRETNMLLQNSLFRSGGAAIALTNRSTDYAFGRCKYKLEHTVRTNLAHDDQAYGCVFQDEDKEGKRGVRLGKELMGVAGRAMQRNLTRLGPLILPWSEQLKFGVNMLARSLDCKLRIVDKLVALGVVAPMPPPSEEEVKKEAEKAAAALAKATALAEATGKAVKIPRASYRSRIPEYTPNFKKAVDHICIHAGGRAVIDAIQAGLRLTDDDVEASRHTLKKYGNTSSSSIWYEFRYVEENRHVRKGERVWQLGFGSGFKCNSAVWRKL